MEPQEQQQGAGLQLPNAYVNVYQQQFNRRLVPKRNSILDDYTIPGKTLGVGVNGKVKLCVGKHNGKHYALKILNDTPKARREIDLHFRCCLHPNIVGIHDVYENLNDNRRCLLLVMDCMEGGELFERIQKKTQFTEREAAELVKGVASAVQHIHAQNIAHRDLKPENLLFVDASDRSALKLTDFGFAKEVDQVLQTPCYTPYYVAPEVLHAEQRKASRYDKSCDMWSLGVILYILLCGYPPFYSEGGAHISPGMKRRIRSGVYDFPEEEWGCISKSVKELIRRLLHINPEKRMTIDEMMMHPWIAQSDEVPSTPLHSIRTLRDDPGNITGLKEEMEQALSHMRVDEHKMVKPITAASSSLLARRKEKTGP
eukprot:comp22840_c0_seq1/m.35961 comp22840_c0_seq1/g.35961  ORF comp22840_c0_seq1/g.35961 comp22840_c0_seq1/m.35961 type:complete len:371 (-) comp22840_c0_seq1:248-1360(-)